jgi:pyrroloquinoline quinone biosynthesis protein E
VNAVVHRRNLDNLPAIVEEAAAMGAARLEVAHTQYHGWALANRAALMPTRAQVDFADRTVAAARERWAGRMAIDYVTPDYHASRPKACMGGWGRRFITVAPDGTVLPCHAAAELPGTTGERLTDRPLAAIWAHGADFERFRGTAWMPEPCRSCDRREVDFGGCRCQAFALTGDPAATDPVCALSPHHDRVTALAEAPDAPPAFTPRRPGNRPAPANQPEEEAP